MLIGGRSAIAQPSEQPAPTTNVTDSLDKKNDYETSYDECTSAPADTVGQKVDDFVFGLVNLDEQARKFRCFDKSVMAHPGDAFSTAVSSASSAFWGDPIGDFTKSVMEGNTQAFRTVMTFWISTDIPGLAADNAMQGLQNIISGFTAVALFASIVIAMTKLAVARKQAVMEGATETAHMLVRTVITVTCLPALVMMFHRCGDLLSKLALERFVGGNLDQQITAITAFDDKTGLGPILALACAGFAFLGSVAQLIALLIREAVLCVVVAVIPIAAASSATGTGRSSYKSMIAFTLGALLFKPVATLLYLFAFWAASASSTDQVASVIIGSMLLAVVGFSLPSLIKIVAPAADSISAGGREVSALGAAGGAMMGGAAGTASRALAGGSKTMSGSASGSTGSGGGSGTGARGTPGMQGRYTGGSSSGSSHAGASSGPMGSARRAGSAGRTATSAGLKGAAGALRAAGTGGRMAGSAASQFGAAAEGAVGNYHGRIQR